MAPKGDDYSQVTDEYFDDLVADGSVFEFSIEVVAFWKYNVKVIDYEVIYRIPDLPDLVESFTATANTTIKSGFALYADVGPSGTALEPPLNSAIYYAPHLYFFNATYFFTHRGKWYIHDVFATGEPDITITADFSSLVVEFGAEGNRTTRTYTVVETFY